TTLLAIEKRSGQHFQSSEMQIVLTWMLLPPSFFQWLRPDRQYRALSLFHVTMEERRGSVYLAVRRPDYRAGPYRNPAASDHPRPAQNGESPASGREPACSIHHQKGRVTHQARGYLSVKRKVYSRRDRSPVQPGLASRIPDRSATKSPLPGYIAGWT